ncbi:hypothetical protein NA57DRAFT_73641 [Rhizodiscina lignyota]|uniref:Uncharacterized protein n=1 Tax=Rhizodiscina lignyota TaxID=1504668 RepID=A0A9P4IN04_9PEZI|nr:hypothetical protein NA57DRAFT_73641 [Rhizodiscina lignyota]
MEQLRRRSGGGGGVDVPYNPPPSVGHEIGVMFGGIAAFLISSILFWVWWNWAQKREDRIERERVEAFRQAGGWGAKEKQLKVNNSDEISRAKNGA